MLRAAAAATISAMSTNGARPLTAAPVVRHPKPTADCLIVLWMAGGMAHTETFDPKAHVPFTPGMKASDIISTFPAIDTVVDGIQFSAGLEHLARVIDRGTLIRTMTGADLGRILHSRHQYHWHTGYEPPQTVAAPHLGAWIAHTLGPRHEAMPAFIDIGQGYEGNGEAEELKAFQTGGFLGSEFGPFRVPDPSRGIEAVRPPAGMSLERFENRRRAFERLLAAGEPHEAVSDFQREALLRSLDGAHRLLTSEAARAFDLSLEPRESFDKYDTGRFGLGCLLARRLVEHGARFIEVTTEYVPFLGWDTHDNGHTRLVEMKRQIDRPIAQLVLDLEARGLLDRTLIVLASEFSRSVLVEGKIDRPVPNQVKQPDTIEELAHFGMHRHFTGAGSVLLFGGGMRRGHAHGQTAAESPCTTIADPVTITDLHSTLYTAMGISPAHGVEIERRPFYVTQDGVGKPVAQLFERRRG